MSSIKKRRLRVNFSSLKKNTLYAVNNTSNTVAGILKGIETAKIVSHAL